MTQLVGQALPSLPMKFECDGTDISSKVVSISVKESLSSPLVIDILLQLNEKDPKTYLDKGCKLSLTTAPPVTERKYHFSAIANTEYIGKVTHERRMWTRGPAGTTSLRSRLRIETPLALLRNGQTFQIFYKKKFQEIFKTILDFHKHHFSGTYAVTTSTVKMPAITPEYMVQYNESDLDFLLRLCEEYGIGIVQQDNQILFLEGDKLSSGSKVELNYDGFSSWERIEAQLSRKLTTRNLKPGEPAESKIAKSEKPFGTPKTVVHQMETFLDEKSGKGGADEYLQIWAESLTHQKSGFVLRADYDWKEGSGVFSPAVGLRVGHIVKGPPKEAENESFVVEAVNWSFLRDSKEQEYKFEAILRSTETPYAPPRTLPTPREHGFLRAQVIEPRSASGVDADPKLGRVKVLFLWDNEDESTRSSRTCWVRLASSYMGKEHGLYIMPEVEDEVLVAFEGGDLHRPVVIGSLPDRESALLKELTGDAALQLETFAFNSPKGIKARIWEKLNTTKHKVTLELTDKIKLGLLAEDDVDVNLYSEGTGHMHAKKSITIKSEEMIELLCGESKLTMKKDGTIVMEGKDITIKGSNNITIQATNDLKNSGKAITSDAQLDHKMSGTNVKINAKANAEMAANANVDIKANANATIKANVNAELSGTMTKVAGNATAELSGSAMATIKGGIVKIN